MRVPVTAGPHDVSVAFVEDPPVAEPQRLQPFVRSSIDNFDWAGRPHMQTFTITGPFNATGAGDTPSRRRIFACRPQDASQTKAPCAERILSTLARRAYRAPGRARSTCSAIMKIYREGPPARGTFETGHRDGAGAHSRGARSSSSASSAIRRNVVAGHAYRISDVELASRLSFFLWSSIPDDELLRVAERGQAEGSRDARRAGARGCWPIRRSQALVDNFAGQWLQLRNVRNVQPNSDLFPDFDDNLRQAFKRETELFFESIMREDRPVLELMTADYTFVNERLARHYGIPNIYGSRSAASRSPTTRRRGLLGQGSILAVTSHAERTSPVVRGKWILDNILGAAGAAAAADVPQLKENVDGEKPRTMREQMAEHRANPVCATCHKVMDPIGFALENFDAVGAWRTEDAGAPIDASGQLADGTKVDGVVDAAEGDAARIRTCSSRTMTEKLLIYALGRGLDDRDMPAVRAIMREAARARLSVLVARAGHRAQHAVPDADEAVAQSRSTEKS